MKSKAEELFGSMVFNDRDMERSLPEEVFRELQETRKEGKALNSNVADAVAAAMKNWAISKGATHFTHWFQPMTGITAEKHDAFLSPGKSGAPILEFTGKELMKGEPDASSFPSGGLRATFEARGYTAWDPTSDAFIKEDTLCIPTAFCSYTGEMLDKKTPLLKSMDALSKEAVRVLHLLGKDVKRVTSTVGCEQEYFLINKEDYAKRPDLILTGRTLFGASAPKGQEMNDHYFGMIRPRVKAYMADLDEELWKLGIYSKTEHNEVAPCQHEMAPVYAISNVAADQNQLVMEMMKKVADRHGFVCLLHEKPFEGINGSGKHNNWAISTDEGENLLSPGKTPGDNQQFLLFLAAVVRAVDDYQDLLRISVATAGNDHRLGGHEAPPAIISMYVGDTLTNVIDTIVTGRSHRADSGTKLRTALALPDIPKDNSDRNRTSPFAFTGNKFEFRMPGSSLNISCTNIMLNTAMAESLRVFANKLEKAAPEQLGAEIDKLVKSEFKAHKRILFDGNGYSDEWVKEAEKRGLLNLKATPDAYKHFMDEKNIKLFRTHGIYTETEMRARQQVGFEEYTNTLHIEAETMLQMVNRQIFPKALEYAAEVARGIETKKRIGISSWEEEELARVLTAKVQLLKENADKLQKLLAELPEGAEHAADYMCRTVLPQMNFIRTTADEMEGMTAKEYYPYPDYTDILFYV